MVEQVEFVPRLEPRRFRRDADLLQHRFDIGALRDGIGMSDVADMDQHIGRDDLFQRRFESGDKLGRQFRDETDGVGQDRLVEPGQADLP